MRLIDADALKKAFCDWCDSSDSANSDIVCGKSCATLDLFDSMPTIEAEPVRHGRWIKQENGLNLCSVCGVAKVSHLPFCGHCGARMDATDTNVGGKGGAENVSNV